jgi:hypothetical protein
MITSNPIADVPSFISPMAMQIYVIVMFILVVGGTILDVIHKKSARYFFENAKKAEAMRKREVSGGEKMGLAVATVTSEVLTSSEFCNPKRRLAHLLTMYGFVIFIVSTVALVFAYPTAAMPAPKFWPFLWHLGALMLAVGGYWFWFFIRVDVSAEGHKWYQLQRADLFIVSLLTTSTFALIWSYLRSAEGGVWAILFFWLFVLSSTVLFGSVLWSKFAHMFFKPAAAFQKRITKADGSRENLPADYDLSDPAVQAKFPDIPEYMGKNPPNMGLGIKREAPRHY